MDKLEFYYSNGVYRTNSDFQRGAFLGQVCHYQYIIEPVDLAQMIWCHLIRTDIHFNWWFSNQPTVKSGMTHAVPAKNVAKVERILICKGKDFYGTTESSFIAKMKDGQWLVGQSLLHKTNDGMGNTSRGCIGYNLDRVLNSVITLQHERRLLDPRIDPGELTAHLIASELLA